ncbi:MAG: putative DNA binding domain-containing protein [Elusimicrobiota bacterium]|jgi:predicted HTH transcriptional regulator|nr:putative DNA binding domain-containing protein [Elusimicrobiota bacterium]
MDKNLLKTETFNLEYKEKLTEDIEKEAVAFLNSKGGDIYIGMKNDGTIIGMDNADEVQLKIKDRLINNIRPSIMGLFDIIVELVDDKTIIVIKFASGVETPYYIKQKGRSESGCFIRIGSSCQPMAEEMINGFMSRRHPPSLSKMPSNHQDLTFRQLKIFYEEKGKNLNEHFLQSLDFLIDGIQYNQLAYLFSDVNRVSIRIGKYADTEKLDLIGNEEYGDCSLLKAMHKVLDRLEVENITQARKQGLKPRLEKKLVDKDALREAIINAFAHNDYSRGDTPIFEIFADRFDITSYGALVEGLSKEDFFKGISRPRNREIMRIFKDLELVQLGSGMPKIVRKYGKDSFQFFSDVIRISLKFDKEMGDKGQDNVEGKRTTPETILKTREKTTLKTTLKTTQKIIEAIRVNPNITIPKLSSLLGLSREGIKWNIQILKKQNIIRRTGSKRGGHWEIVEESQKTDTDK